MDEVKSLVDIKEYGKVHVKLSEILDQRKITRNKLRTLTGIKYEVIDRYYKAENIELVDLDFIAKVCFVLNVKVEDILEYRIE
ncbi:MAG: helix-turn-helix domain-containing protein [Oscillospiraceae bacterium]